MSSRIEPAHLLRFTRTCGILDFPVFEKKIRVPFDFVSLFHTRSLAHGADMVVESRNMSDDVLFTPELIVLMPPTIC